LTIEPLYTVDITHTISVFWKPSELLVRPRFTTSHPPEPRPSIKNERRVRNALVQDSAHDHFRD